MRGEIACPSEQTAPGAERTPKGHAIVHVKELRKALPKGDSQWRDRDREKANAPGNAGDRDHSRPERVLTSRDP
ncbi:MAG: hypothetical protein ACTSRA_02390, partial [Promethearchaeota archaeon]